jgi:hypothetical protein
VQALREAEEGTHEGQRAPVQILGERDEVMSRNGAGPPAITTLPGPTRFTALTTLLTIAR